MHRTSTTCDVLIIGAGPVGLARANELHRWGVSFHIVDQKAEPERHRERLEGFLHATVGHILHRDV